MIKMQENKIEDLLLQLIQDMAFVKSKLESIEAQNLGTRIDTIEAQNKEHDRIIKSLERRANTMEEFTRSQITDARKQQTSVFISLGMAIFSAILSIVTKLF